MAETTDKVEKKTSKSPRNEDIVHEYPAIDKYRVRVLRKSTSKGKTTSLDVREYVDAEKFQGFTRKGIRLTGPQHINSLRDALSDALARGWFDSNGAA